MHNNFYASGFLYHIPSQQILLQQTSSTVSNNFFWSLFGDVMHANESSKTTFKRVMHKLLHIEIPEEYIFDIYDYFHADLGKTNMVIYAELHELIDFPPVADTIFTWVKTKNIYKLPLSEQMKRDIVVGERVINARNRALLEMEIKTA